MNVHVCLTVEAKLRGVATNKRTFFEINNLQNLKNSIKRATCILPIGYT